MYLHLRSSLGSWDPAVFRFIWNIGSCYSLSLLQSFSHPNTPNTCLIYFLNVPRDLPCFFFKFYFPVICLTLGVLHFLLLFQLESSQLGIGWLWVYQSLYLLPVWEAKVITGFSLMNMVYPVTLSCIYI